MSCNLQASYERRNRPGHGLTADQIHVVVEACRLGQDCYNLVEDEEGVFINNGSVEEKIEQQLPPNHKWGLTLEETTNRCIIYDMTTRRVPVTKVYVDTLLQPTLGSCK